MKRKLLLLMAAALLLPVIAGCSRLMKGEYYTEEAHTEPREDGQSSSAYEVYGYESLKNAITNMVKNCIEYGSVHIAAQYRGADAVKEMSKACLEVTRQTAIGAFAVDYMTHSYTKTLNGYDMELYITYKRTPEQIFSVKEYPYLSSALDAFDRLIADRERYLAIRLDTSILDGEYLRQRLDDMYLSGGYLLISKPEMTVSVYPETGMQRIIEINVDYGRTRDAQDAMYIELLTACTRFGVSGDTQEKRFLSLSRRLFEETEYAEDAGDKGSTSYGALVEKRADDEGLAMAVKQLCMHKGFECEVVRGTLDGREHCWNILTADGERYHFDISAMYSEGEERSLFLRDADMTGYEWDTEKHSPCAGAMTYEEVVRSLAEKEGRDLTGEQPEQPQPETAE